MTTGIMPDGPGKRQDGSGPGLCGTRLFRRATGFRPALVLGVSADAMVRDAALAESRTLLAAPQPRVEPWRVVELDALALAGSAAGASALDARIREVAASTEANVRTVAVVSGFEAVDLAGRTRAALAAAIARHGVSVVAVTTPQVASVVEDDPLLAPLVALVALPEMPASAGIVDPISRHHGVDVPAAVVDAATELVRRYLLGAPPLATVADVLDEAAAGAAARGADAVTPDDVRQVGADRTGIPPARLLADDLAHLRTLESQLHDRIVGQDAAVAAVAAAVRRRRAGVGDPDRPLGSFLFVGPTGVGKTELARALASTLFTGERALIRLDMGEYQEPQSVARLVGAPPGYVGYGHGGHLSEPLRRNPASVVLLDEIEKAHDDVFSTLLAVLEDGRLTDGEGRVVDARHAVLIMTSNLGTAAAMEVSADAAPAVMTAAVARRFAPEFRNRIDEIVVFTRLTTEQLQDIVTLRLRELQQRMAARNITVEVTQAACAWLAERGADPVYGARPLRREIRRHVEDRLADEIVAGRLDDGGSVVIDRRRDGLVLTGGR